MLESNMFDTAHNIAISGNGVMFLEVPGMRAYTLTDPLNPVFQSRQGKFGHDATPVGTTVYDFTGSTAVVNVWNASNPAGPVLLGTVSGGLTYAHSGDVTGDGNTLYVCDELSSHPIPDVTVWDITSLAAPVKVAEIADPSATVHNLYIVDDFAFVAYYTAGFKVFDLSDPATPVLADSYDTSGYSGDGFDGAFGVYPYAPSGHVYVTDHPNGLYVFDVERNVAASTAAPASAGTLSCYPNPFNPSTTIAWGLVAPTAVTLAVYDARGRRVRTLAHGTFGPGHHQTAWNGTADDGEPMPSGVYFCRLDADGAPPQALRLTLIK